MNKGSYRAIANPWYEDDFITVAAQDFDAGELQPNPERIQNCNAISGRLLWGETLLMRGISVEVHGTFKFLDDLNRESRLDLRSWSQIPLVETRSELKN